MSRLLLQQMSLLCLTVAVLLAYAVASATAKHAESKTQNQQASLFRLCNLSRTTVELGSAWHFAVLSSKQTRVQFSVKTPGKKDGSKPIQHDRK